MTVTSFYHDHKLCHIFNIFRLTGISFFHFVLNSLGKDLSVRNKNRLVCVDGSSCTRSVKDLSCAKKLIKVKLWYSYQIQSLLL